MQVKDGLITLQQHIPWQLPRHRLHLWFIPVGLAMLLSSSLLLAIYQLPYTHRYSVDGWLRHTRGTHERERANELEYAYTNGNAVFTLPEVGAGHFLSTIQIGSLLSGTDSTAHLGTSAQQVDLGVVRDLRRYHLLLPTNEQGHLRMRLTSSVQFIADDPRPLGVLVGQVAVQAVGGTIPAPLQLMTTLLALSLCWLAIAPLPAAVMRKAVLLLLLGAVFGISSMLGRGVVALQYWWVGLGTAAIVSMILWQIEARMVLASWRGMLLLWGVWRVALWLVALAGVWLGEVVFRQWRGFSFSFGPPDEELGSLVWRAMTIVWMNWDGAHYQSIAESGYTFEGVPWPSIAFFPLYPLLMRAVMSVSGASAMLGALVVSNVALLVAVLLLYDLLRHDFGLVIAYRAIIFLLVFPTAFFFVAGYTESLALLLTIGAVWAMRRQRWWLTGLMGCLLAMTRVPGVLIAPVLGLAYLQHHQWRLQWKSFDLLAVLLPPLGLGLFMLYQWQTFGTPWAFLIAQQSWSNGLAFPWAIPMEIVRELTKPSAWMLASLQLGVWIGVLGLAFLALRRLPLVYSLTGFLLIVPAYCANIRDSLPRHVLISFPIFVVLACRAQSLWLRWLIVTLLLPLLVLLTVLYVNGFWIA